MCGAIAVNVATYHAVIRLQTALPSHLERGMIEDPVILEDPIGRLAPVHLQFVTSWDAFNSVLELRFENIQGHKKMIQRDYGLQDGANGREIEQSRPWQRAFLPGQRVEMSFIFRREEGADDGNVTCPGCQTASGNSNDVDICCKNCSMWFRRISVVEEEENLPKAYLPPYRRPKAGFTPRPGKAVATGRKRVLPIEFEDEDDVKEFRRVRLISTKKRIKHNDDTSKWPTPLTASSFGLSSDVGQIAPRGRKPLVTASFWEDEDSLCFQVESEGTCIPRRDDNGMINGAMLLRLANITQDRRDSILEAEKTRHIVKVGPHHFKGVWIPFERALEIAINEGIVDKLYPLFTHNIGDLLYHLLNRQAEEGDRFRDKGSSRENYPDVDAHANH